MKGGPDGPLARSASCPASTAGMDALKRVQSNTGEKRLLNGRGLPNFGLNFYVVNAKGEYAGVSMYASRYAVCTDRGAETLPTEPLLPGTAVDPV